MKIKKGFVLRTVMDKPIVLAEGANLVNFGKMIALNESAELIWREMEGKDFSIDDVADVLMDNYEVDRDTAVASATRVTDKWVELGFIEK